MPRRARTEGASRREDDAPLTVQSKLVNPGGGAIYETRFLFDDKGQNVTLLN